MRALPSPANGPLRRTDSPRPTSHLIGPILGMLALASLVVQTQHLLQHRAGAATALLTLAIVFGSALVSSVAGFAFSALAGAGLLHLYDHPSEAVAIMALCSIAIQSYCVIALRRSIEWRRLLPFLVGGAAFVPLGVWLLSELPYRWFAVALGVFLIAYGAMMLCRRQSRVRPGAWWIDLCVGALGGITGGLAAFPGAFVTMWCSMRGWDKSVQRAVTQPYILSMQLITLVTMHAACRRAHRSGSDREHVRGSLCRLPRDDRLPRTEQPAVRLGAQRTADGFGRVDGPARLIGDLLRPPTQNGHRRKPRTYEAISSRLPLQLLLQLIDETPVGALSNDLGGG